MKINVSIVTPEQDFFEGEADYIQIPSVRGSLGILPGHAPIICFLDLGIVKIENEKIPVLYAVARGYLQFVGNKAVILTETALKTDESNKDEAIKELGKKHNISLEITQETKRVAQATAAAVKTLHRF